MSETPAVSIRLYASLARYAPPDADAHPVRSGMSIRDVAEELGIPPDQVKLIFVDGKKEDPEFRLFGGERVGLFPPVGGG